MKNKKVLTVALVAGIWTSSAWAGIPEPDAIIYGRVFIDGVQTTSEDVVIIARVDVGGNEQEVGRCGIGEVSDVNDLYVLRVRLESLADGSDQSENAALIGQTVRIYLKEGETEPEELQTEVPISERGLISELDLGLGCTIVATVPPNCAVDARHPSRPDGTGPDGWGIIELHFSDADLCNLGAMGAADFQVTLEPAGTAPTIADVVVSGRVVALHLSEAIPTGAWTCFNWGTTRKCIGCLPGDVNGDYKSAPSDILQAVDCLNGVASCEIWQCDVDRSGVCGPPDILRVIDLLNGAGVYDEWLNVQIGACPSE